MQVGKRSTSEPDARIAVRLRAELARCRQDGLGWSNELFRDCVGYALIAVQGDDLERSTWHAAFSWSESHWRDGFERQGGAFRKGLPSLID